MSYFGYQHQATYYSGANKTKTTINYDTLNENSERAIQPDKIDIELKANQLAIIQKARELEEGKIDILNDTDKDCSERLLETKLIVIADKVGAGKSYSMLGIIASKSDLPSKQIVRSFETGHNAGASWTSQQTSFMTVFERHHHMSFNVLVVPHGVFTQWKQYIEDNTSLKLYTVLSKKTILAANKVKDYCNYDIILVKSTMYNEFAKIVNTQNMSISRLIFDEPDTIKISNCQNIKASRYYFITSSINDIRTKTRIRHNGFIKEIVSQLQCFDPKVFKHIILKNSDDFIKMSFALPLPIKRIIKCKSSLAAQILVGLVDDDVLQMINAGDMGAVYDKYEMSVTSNESVIQMVCKDLERDLTNLHIEVEAKKKQQYKHEKNRKLALERLADRIKRTEQKIEAIRSRVIDEDCCPICMDDIDNKSLTPCCKNVFCFECLAMSISRNSRCPMCSTDIPNIKDVIIIDDDLANVTGDELVEKTENIDNFNTEEHEKEENFAHIVDNMKDKKDKRILIFSEFDGSFDQVLEALKKNNLAYSELKGQSSHIANVVRKYKEGEIQALLLNSKYFGSGLNLENTTDMFVMHKMPSDMEKQVIGRAQRPGRTSALNVYFLYNSNEYN